MVVLTPDATLPYRERIKCTDGDEPCVETTRLGYPCRHAAFVLKWCGACLKILREKRVLSDTTCKKYTVSIFFISFMSIYLIYYAHSISTRCGIMPTGTRRHIFGNTTLLKGSLFFTWTSYRAARCLHRAIFQTDRI